MIFVAYELNLSLNMEKPHYRSQGAGEWSLIWAHDSRPIYRALTYIAVPLLGPHQPRYIGLTLYRNSNCGDKTILQLSTMGFPILIRWHFYIEMGSRPPCGIISHLGLLCVCLCISHGFLNSYNLLLTRLHHWLQPRTINCLPRLQRLKQKIKDCLSSLRWYRIIST